MVGMAGASHLGCFVFVNAPITDSLLLRIIRRKEQYRKIQKMKSNRLFIGKHHTSHTHTRREINQYLLFAFCLQNKRETNRNTKGSIIAMRFEGSQATKTPSTTIKTNYEWMQWAATAEKLERESEKRKNEYWKIIFHVKYLLCILLCNTFSLLDAPPTMRATRTRRNFNGIEIGVSAAICNAYNFCICDARLIAFRRLCERCINGGDTNSRTHEKSGCVRCRAISSDKYFVRCLEMQRVHFRTYSSSSS